MAFWTPLILPAHGHPREHRTRPPLRTELANTSLPSDDLTGTVIGQEQLEELIRGTGRDPIDDLRLTNDD